MILTILNNPRLGLNLLVVWLILGVGLLPEKAEGLKCYKCDGAACKSAPPDTDCTTGFCLTINKGKDSEKKDCAASAKEGECIKEKGGCFTGTDDNQADMDKCSGTEAQTAVDKGTELCVCEGDHCNGEKKDDKKTDDKKDGGGDDKDEKKDKGDGTGNGVECYLCTIGHCKDKSLDQIEKVKCDTNVCLQLVKDNRVVSRECANKLKDTSCYDKGGGCLGIVESIECDEETGSKAPETAEGRKSGSRSKICVCSGALCNGEILGKGMGIRAEPGFFFIWSTIGASFTAYLKMI